MAVLRTKEGKMKGEREKNRFQPVMRNYDEDGGR